MTDKTKEATKGASSAPSKAKLQAMVKATNLSTGKSLYVSNKLGSVTMSTPSAYELAKRHRESPITGPGWTYEVQLIKRG
jgi:hypothetical protein